MAQDAQDATTVLVTGAGGQLGRELLRSAWPAGIDVVGHTSAQLDITDTDAVAAAIDTHRPSVIVNAAAYTAVDRAETEPERAHAVNATAVADLTRRSDDAGALLVHVSTDYVFDGTQPGWYTEDDPVCPTNVYGRTKAAGEEACLGGVNTMVVRTSWVYGALGPNFVATMLRLANERDRLGVVDDQWGCPTATPELSAAIVELATIDDGPPARLVHVAAPDDATWYGLATAAIDEAGGFVGSIDALTTEQYPTPASRPANSRLDTGLLRDIIGRRLPPWRTSLPAVVAELTTGAPTTSDGTASPTHSENSS